MFLPDGKALIMDNELYKATIEKSIVIDLVDNNQAVKQEGPQNNSHAIDE